MSVSVSADRFVGTRAADALYVGKSLEEIEVLSSGTTSRLLSRQDHETANGCQLGCVRSAHGRITYHPSPRKWMEQMAWKFVLIAIGLLMVPVVARAETPSVIEVAKFSSGTVGQAMPDGWKPLIFKKIPKHTSYEVVKDGGVTIVKAVSEASASGLTKPVVIDPREYPIVRWRWKIDHVLQRSDVALKEGDDFSARLYITFEYDPDKVSFGKKLKFKAGQALFGDIPIAALNYIWDTKGRSAQLSRMPIPILPRWSSSRAALRTWVCGSTKSGIFMKTIRRRSGRSRR